MLRRWIGKLALLALAGAAASTLAACGSMLTVGVGVDDRYGPGWDDHIYLYDGVWQGKYVYYHGEWHYKGYGTPYIYDPWDYYW